MTARLISRPPISSAGSPATIRLGPPWAARRGRIGHRRRRPIGYSASEARALRGLGEARVYGRACGGVSTRICGFISSPGDMMPIRLGIFSLFWSARGGLSSLAPLLKGFSCFKSFLRFVSHSAVHLEACKVRRHGEGERKKPLLEHGRKRDGPDDTACYHPALALPPPGKTLENWTARRMPSAPSPTRAQAVGPRLQCRRRRAKADGPPGPGTIPRDTEPRQGNLVRGERKAGSTARWRGGLAAGGRAGDWAVEK